MLEHIIGFGAAVFFLGEIHFVLAIASTPKRCRVMNIVEVSSARQVSICLVDDMMGMWEEDNTLDLCGVNPNYAVRRSGCGDGVWDRNI